MLHVRAIVPAQLTDQVQRLLAADDAVTHVSVMPGVAVSPRGDVVEFDVVREGASPILEQLREIGLEDGGPP
jgi:hypothetical protein